MTFNRLKISLDTTQKLRTLKIRTGLTPNILCRLALCFSLNIDFAPSVPKTDEEGQEFNRYTLLGEHDPLFIALIKERCKQDGLDPENDLVIQFKAHVERGVMSLYSRVKDIGDLQNLLQDYKK